MGDFPTDFPFSCEDFLNPFLSSSPNGIVVCNVDGNIIYKNMQIAFVLQLDQTALSKKSLHLSEISEEAWDAFNDVLNNKKISIEKQFMLGDEIILFNIMILEQNFNPVYGLCLFQNKSGIQAITSSISDFQQITREMRKSVESAFDGVLVTDSRGIIIRISKSWEEIIGISSDEVIGKSIYNLEKQGFFPKSAVRVAINEQSEITLKKQWHGKKIGTHAIPIFDSDNNIKIVICRIENFENNDYKYAELLELNLKQSQSDKKNEELSEEEFAGIVFASDEFRELIKLAKRIASYDAPVIIEGETGVGKEVIADFIHNVSPRKNHPLIKINCGAIPDQLLESELFGYEGGAFTGAKAQGKQGLFQAANKGTLVLDEISELPLHLQVKLLRVLQDMEIMPVGGTQSKKFDVRIIALSNKDLRECVEHGSFRNDLYYRLNVIPLHISPLRSRPADILALINHFINITKDKYNKDIWFSDELINVLKRYGWPGNVRQMINFIQHIILTVNKKDCITTDDIPDSIKNKLHTSLDIYAHSYKAAVKNFEAQLLKKAIAVHGNIQEAAYHLKINPATIYRKLKSI